MPGATLTGWAEWVVWKEWICNSHVASYTSGVGFPFLGRSKPRFGGAFCFRIAGARPSFQENTVAPWLATLIAQCGPARPSRQEGSRLKGGSMIRPSIKGQRLAALFLLGFLLFNYPLLNLFAGPGQVWGIPLLYVYVFAVWALLIGLMALVVEKRND